MPVSVTSSYATANLSSSAPQTRITIPANNAHASALPLYGDYVVESPAVATTGLLPPSAEQEDYVFCDPVAHSAPALNPHPRALVATRFILTSTMLRR
jgi:hypothetical protein